MVILTLGIKTANFAKYLKDSYYILYHNYL